jgi:hypothetical protein
MQIQTTTITTEQTQSFGANFQITVFEQETTAFCDTCPNNASGTKQTLENRGWYLGSREQFCPECNF